jgi:hypothetical protein
MVPHHIIIVGSEKGGVGKTILSRLLLCYLASRVGGVDYRAYDAQTPGGILKRFHPDRTELVDVMKSDGQLRIFDSLRPRQVTVIDLAAGQLEFMLRLVGELNFLEDVKFGRLKITVMHVIGSTLASFDEIRRVADLVEGSRHFLVANHINEAAYLGLTAEHRAAASGLVTITKLNELAAETVDQAGVSFDDYCGNETNSRTLRGYIEAWKRKAFAEFGSVGLIG